MFGPERVGMLTLSFPDPVHDMSEASRRFDSFNSNALAGRYVQWLVVVQRHKTHGIHFHLCIVTEKDIRGNLDFRALRCRDYLSANAALRAEWSFYRDALPRYGFGRHELLPMRGDSVSFGRYLSRYLARELGTRRADDRGHRMVRYSQSWRRIVRGAFSWNDIRAVRARSRAEKITCVLWGTHWKMVRDVGPAWRWHLRRTLYCDNDLFRVVLALAEHDLEYYRGAQFALDEAWATIDRQRDEWEKKYPPGLIEAMESRDYALDGVSSQAFKPLSLSNTNGSVAAPTRPQEDEQSKNKFTGLRDDSASLGHSATLAAHVPGSSPQPVLL
jgi:hypothetical protein